MLADLTKLGTIVVIPAIVALVVSLGWRRLLHATVLADAALAVGGGVGFFVGYVLLPDWAALTPARHWHWLPYLAIAITVTSAIFAAVRSPIWGHALLMIVLGGVAAWLLVPTWNSLRPTLMPLVAAYLAAIAILLMLLPARLRGRNFLALLTATLLATALGVAVEVSLMYGEVAGVAMGIMAGLWGALFLLLRYNRNQSAANQNAGQPKASAAESPRGDTEISWTRLTLAIIPLYALLAGGIAFIGAIEPSTPVYPFLLIPAAPLALWLFVFAPFSRCSGLGAIVAQTFAVALIPLAVIGWIIWHGEPDEWGDAALPTPAHVAAN